MASASTNPHLSTTGAALQLPPTFFKIYSPNTMEERTKIPSAFLEHFDIVMPKCVFLRNRFAYEWEVQLQKEEGEIYLAKGWKTFIVQNVSRVGELLLFVMDNWNTFYVEFFGVSTCLRQNAYWDDRRSSPVKLKYNDIVVRPASPELRVPVLKFKIEISQTHFVKNYLPIPKVWWKSVTPIFKSVPNKVILNMGGKWWRVRLNTEGRIKMEGKLILDFLAVNSIVVGHEIMLELDQEAEFMTFHVTLVG